jgi:hypothetical protein
VGSTKSRVWFRSLLGVAVILGGPAILIALLRSAYQSSPEPGKVDPGVFQYTQPAQPARPSPPARATATPVSPPPARNPGVAHVYECRKDGQLIYSGQPCGHDSITRDVDVRPQLSLSQSAECADIQKEIGQITARMRQPYSSAEGKWFGERLRTLNDRLNALKCDR